MLANGERVKGIVTRITDKGVDIRLGKYSGFIDNAQLSWAKKTLRSKQKFLESGDVVWVAAVSDPKNPYNPDEAELNKPIRLSLQCVPELQGALISIEPETGDVVAMVGGYSFQESQFNRADAGVPAAGVVLQAHRLLRRAGQRLYGGLRHPRRARGAVP